MEKKNHRNLKSDGHKTLRRLDHLSRRSTLLVFSLLLLLFFVILGLFPFFFSLLLFFVFVESGRWLYRCSFRSSWSAFLSFFLFFFSYYSCSFILGLCCSCSYSFILTRTWHYYLAEKRNVKLIKHAAIEEFYINT